MLSYLLSYISYYFVVEKEKRQFMYVGVQQNTKDGAGRQAASQVYRYIWYNFTLDRRMDAGVFVLLRKRDLYFRAVGCIGTLVGCWLLLPSVASVVRAGVSYSRGSLFAS